MKNVSPTSIPLTHRAGRWEATEESLIANWSSASVSFFFSGTKLSLRAGPATERKDKNNGGTPSLAVLTGATEEDAMKTSSFWTSADPKPDSEVVIFDEQEKTHDKTFVRIVLIDWASKFELSALITDDNGHIDFDFDQAATQEKKVPQILLIGDSISSAMAVSVDQGGELVPYGILDGYSFVAQRLLLEKDISKKVQIELVAYPGLNLVSPTPEEKVNGNPMGMADAFFWKSISTKETFTPSHRPDVIMIALGTNDQYFKIAKDRFCAAIADLIHKINANSNASTRHVWLVPPFPDADTDNHDLNDAMPSFVPVLEKEFAGAQIKFRVCDLVDGLTAKDTVDGVHLSLKAHARVGERFAGFIERELF